MKTLKMKILAVAFSMAALFAFSIQSQVGAVSPCKTQQPYVDPDGPGPEVAECDEGSNLCCTIGLETFLKTQ